MTVASGIGWRRVLLWGGLAVVALLAAGSVYEGLRNALAGSKDFEWSPSRLLLLHQNPYAVFLGQVASGHGTSRFLMTQFPTYPAYSLVFLWPFAALPWPVAQAAWALSNLLLAVGVVILIHRLYFKETGSPATFFALLSLLLASTPYRVTLGNGQHGLFCLFFFLAAVHTADGKRPILASLLLAVSLLKYSVTVPLSLLFLRRDRIGIAIAAAAIDLAVMGFAAAWSNSSLVDMFRQLFLVQAKAMSYGYLDVFDLLRVLGDSGRPAAFVLASLAVLASLWIVLGDRLRDELLVISLLSLAACIATPHLLYDFVMYVFPLAYTLRLVADGPRPRICGVLAISFVAAIVPIWYVQRIIEAVHYAHPDAASALIMSICWAWIIAGTYAAFGLGVLASLRRLWPSGEPAARPVRAATA